MPKPKTGHICTCPHHAYMDTGAVLAQVAHLEPSTLQRYLARMFDAEKLEYLITFKDGEKAVIGRDGYPRRFDSAKTKKKR
jgi:hypothetical protein